MDLGNKRKKHREYMKEWRLKNPEKIKEIQKKYYEKKGKVWRESNKELVKQIRERFKKNNSEKIKESQKKWKINNTIKVKEDAKKWRENNREKLKEYHKSYHPIYYQNNRDKILIKQSPYRIILNSKSKCELCSINEKLTIHHTDKNHQNNDKENLKILCKNCHAKLHNPKGIKIGERIR